MGEPPTSRTLLSTFLIWQEKRSLLEYLTRLLETLEKKNNLKLRNDSCTGMCIVRKALALRINLLNGKPSAAKRRLRRLIRSKASIIALKTRSNPNTKRLTPLIKNLSWRARIISCASLFKKFKISKLMLTTQEMISSLHRWASSFSWSINLNSATLDCFEPNQQSSKKLSLLVQYITLICGVNKMLYIETYCPMEDLWDVKNPILWEFMGFCISVVA